MATSVGDIIVNAKLNTAEFSNAVKSLNASATAAAKTMKNAGETSGSAFNSAAGSVKQLSSAATAAAGAVKNISSGSVRQLGQTADSAAASVKNIASSASVASRAVSGISSSASGAASSLGGIDVGSLTSKFKAIPSAISSAFESVKGVAGNAMGQLASDVSTGLAGGLKGGVAGLASMLQSGLQAAGTAALASITAAAGAVVAGIGTVVKGAVEQFADYQQYVDGVKKIFQDGADIVIANADRAYKSAGLSANKYLENVTDFSATLVKDMNNDFAGAANEADKAITDMADNSNTFGTSMSVLTYAYQGFAKQNYTMLDNLKLGYGGTQSEMAKLVNESGVLGDSVKVTAETVKDVPFNKIIDAIHVVQERLEITGTTSNEAAKTVSGSINTMKAAWENMLTAMGTGQDVEGATKKFTDSVAAVLENITPVIERVVDNIDPVFKKLAKAVQPLWDKYIKPLLDKLAPKVKQYITDILGATLGALGEAMFKVFYSTMQKVYNGIIDFALAIPKAIIEAIASGFGALGDTLGTLWDKGTEIARELWGGIYNVVKDIPAKIVDAATAFGDWLGNVYDKATDIGSSIWDGICDFINNLPQNIINIVTAFDGWLIDVYNKATEIGGNIWNGVCDFIDALPQNIINIITSFNDWLGYVYNRAAEIGGDIWDGVCDFIANLPQAIIDTIADVGAWLDSVYEAGKRIGREIWNGVKEWVKNIPQMISDAVNGAVNSAGDWVGDRIDDIKGVFGYASGGYISGAGTGTSDSIPAMLSNGEYVLSAAAVKSIGVKTLDRMNATGRVGYASGGLVDSSSASGWLSRVFDVVGNMRNNIKKICEQVIGELWRSISKWSEFIPQGMGSAIGDVLGDITTNTGSASSLIGSLIDGLGKTAQAVGISGAGSRITNNYYQFDRRANDRYLYNRIAMGGL